MIDEGVHSNMHWIKMQVPSLLHIIDIVSSEERGIIHQFFTID